MRPEDPRSALVELVRTRIHSLRPKLLDLTRRNPLLSTKFSTRSTSHVRVVDELPDVLLSQLTTGQRMRLVGLPALDDEPRDERTREFQNALSNARLTEEQYLEAVQQIDQSSEQAVELSRKAERALRDRLRMVLGMKPRQTIEQISLVQHAKNNQISPSYDLPQPDEENEDGRHSDTDIQTLLLPDDLERKMNALTTKCRTWLQETGINVLHAAFGFLEWTEHEGTQSAFAPLVLLPVEIEKRKTRDGLEFSIATSGEEAEYNAVLAEKLRLDFGVELPTFQGGSIETYFEDLSNVSAKSLNWRVRRQIALGVFPSARMAMYNDLDVTTGAFDGHRVIDRLLGHAPMADAPPFAEVYDNDAIEVERKVPCLVMDADSSQFSAIADVMSGINLAVEGPPGTGKSQTIVNAIAAALEARKKVLFVAEKTAALNVVKARLEAIGLGEFILPLQADRATRERVIESVRARLEINREAAVSDYDKKIAAFREVRAAIQEYIEILSGPFEKTGFTVYEIFGKSVTNDAMFDGEWAGLRDLRVQEVSTCTRDRIGQLKEAAANWRSAMIEASAAGEHWIGLKLSTMDRFVADEIIELARLASYAYSASAEQRSLLTQYGMPSDIDNRRLEALGRLCRSLVNDSQFLDPAILNRICHQQIGEKVRAFLNAKKAHQVEFDALSEMISEPQNDSIGDQLRELHQCCCDQTSMVLDTKSFVQLRDEAARSRAGLLELKRRLAPFVAEVPIATNWPISALQRAFDIVQSTSANLLTGRRQALADPTAALAVERARSRANNLKERRDRLGGLSAEEIQLEEIQSTARILKSAGAMSVFSSDYRNAKATYHRITGRKNFNKADAWTVLEGLAQWKKQEREFATDAQLSNLFGDKFAGIDTDFHAFSGLLTFYRNIETQLSGIAHRDIRQFLANAEIDLLQSIPQLQNGYEEATFSEIEAAVSELQDKLEKLDRAVTLLESLESVLKNPKSIRVAELLKVANRCDAYQRKFAELQSNDQLLDLLGQRGLGSKISIVELEGLLEASDQIRNLGTDFEIGLCIIEAGKLSDADTAIAKALQLDFAANDFLTRLSERTGIETSKFTSSRTREELVRMLQAAAADSRGLHLHATCYRASKELRDLGGNWIIDAVSLIPAAISDLPRLAEAVCIRNLARAVFTRHRSTLSKFPQGKLDALRSRIAKLDQEIIQLSRRQLRAKIIASASPPRGNGYGRKSTWTESSLLENEVSKTKRFIPVRDITRRAGRALQELKPCWMMSPLAVAQYIAKGTLDFDLVIIDEASQMPPEDALGALVRAHQAMIVGDTNQLGPTTFFKKLLDDDEADYDEAVLEESILDIANSAFRPVRRLRWHYRSRNSALIAFSNHHIYRNDLIVFPSAEEARVGRAVSLKQVSGRYSSGTNVEEARTMIDAIIKFMKDSPDRSLGVVVLNQKQSELLREEMDHALKSEPAASKYIEMWKEKNDGLEEFFIKNLENVQGDERDVIFIGTVYGPEKVGGPVMQRFGPINGLAGRRRLNVLFSRAKHRIVTFSSMTASDIQAQETGNPGAYMLKCWLEYSATGMTHAGHTTHREPDSDLEIFIMDQIRSMGCIPIPQVGAAGYFIDIGVRHQDWPHGYILAVECDGASYHSTKSARDRDRLRQQVLEGLGWHFHRIWSTDWFNDPAAEKERLRQAILRRLEILKRESDVPHEPEAEQTGVEQSADTDAKSDDVAAPKSIRSVTYDRGIKVGDRVRVKYLTGSANTIEVTITSSESSPARGLICIDQPLARALLGGQEGEEIEVLVGSYIRKAIIEKVFRKAT